MDKIDALFVRAAKSRSPEFRIRALYRRFYNNNYKPWYVSGVLSRLVDKYGLMKTNDWIDQMNPENDWRYGSATCAVSYHEKLINIFTSHIYNTPISKFEGFPHSAHWRNKEKA